MHRKTPMLFAGILLATVACSGVDSVGNGIDATDITASAYRLSSGQTLHVSPEYTSVAVGGSVKLSTVVRSSTGQIISASGNLAAKWTSSDTMVARVSNGGVVVGISNGVATITARAADQTSQSTVTVGSGATTTTTTTSPTTTTTTTEPITATAPATTSTTTAPTTSTTSTSTTSSTSTTGTTSLQNAFVYDDFTRYHSTADLQANISTNLGGTGSPATSLYTDGRNPQLAAFDPNVTYNGHPTMRYDQPANSQSTPQLTAGFKGKTLQSFWYKMVVRYSPGWTTTGSITNSANAYKLMDWGWSGSNGRGGIAITNTTQYQIYFYLLVNGSMTTSENNVAFGNVSTEWNDGQWYTYIISFQKTGSTGATVRVWKGVGNNTPQLVATVQGDSYGQVWPAVDRVSVGENFNQMRTQAESVWIGEWSVYDGAQYTNPYNVH